LLSLVFLTLAIAAFAKKTHTHRRAHTSAPATFYANSNTYQTSAGGNVFYLDRNLCSCNRGAIAYFQMNRSNDNLRYYTTCPITSAITGPEMIKFTNYNATNGDHSVNFLDRHAMACPANHVLRNFKVERNPSKMDHIRYKYTCVAANVLCCKKSSSSKQAMGNKSTFYLDRQQIGNHKSKNTAFSALRLRSSYGPDMMWYDYSMCELMDMDAHAAMQAGQAQLKAANDGLIAAGTVQAEAKAANMAVQQQMEALQAQLKQTTAALEAADAAVAAATATSTTAATSLTAAASAPGLKCSS